MELPEHIAIIMDGNGRWARERNLPRVIGHREGARNADRIIEACARMGVKALTLYSFSTENWRRPKEEVSALMGLIEGGISGKTGKMVSNKIRFMVSGRVHELPQSLQDTIARAAAATEKNAGMILNFAINYGGRQEILDAVRKLASEGQKPPSEWTEADISDRLYTAGIPDPDLVIRTSGEMRTSNFLIWQAAYAEYYITGTLWPDFNEAELEKAVEAFASRERRFGA